MFIVKVADNFHYMDRDEVYTQGQYSTWEDALYVAKRIVDAFLLENYSDGMSSDALYAQYTAFGEDPYIVGGSASQEFSAWTYAKEKCEAMCNDESATRTDD